MKSVYVVVPVTKHLAGQHDQSSHGNWSGSPKLTILNEKGSENEFLNESLRVVRYEEKGKNPVDYVLFADGKYKIIVAPKPTDGTNFTGYRGIESKGVGVLIAEGPKANHLRLTSNLDNYFTVNQIAVKPSHQRRGLASAMLQFHRDMYPEANIQHSDALTEDGKSWATVVKHLAGQHDQSTHGNWAGAEGYKSASLDDLPALDLSRLDSTTMDARNNYVGFGYQWMNDYLRSGNIDDTVRIIYNEQIPKEQGIAQIESLKNALYETETTQDLTVTRWSSGASLFRQQVSTMSEEDIKGLVGKTFEAKGFTSTSAPNSLHQSVNDSFKASATVFANIHMPAGTHGATMGNDEEGEFVIAPNTTFVVMGAKRLDETRIVLDLLVTGQENG